MVDVLPEGPEKPVASVRVEHSSNLAFAWMLAALSGAVAISALSAQTGLRLAAPLVIMLAYLYYGFNSPGRNTGKLADSIYFLGFLWTLYALINEFVFRRANVTSAESVYRVFGYALVTTALGIFLRLALLQFHQTASDQMEEARDELDIHLQVLSRELTNAERQLASWRETSATTMAAFEDELRHAQGNIRGRIEAVHTDAALALAGTVRDAVLPLVEELKNITPLTRKMRMAVSTLEKATTASADGLTKASTDFVSKLSENSDAVDKALSANLNRAGAILENAASGYASTVARQGEATTVALSNTTNAANNLLQLLSRFQSATTQLSGELATAKERLGELPRDVAAASSAIGEIRSTGVAKVEAVVNETVAAVSTAKDAAVALNRTVDEVLDFLRKRTV